MNCLPRYQGHSIRMHSGGWFKAKLAKIKDIGNTVKQKTRVGGVLVLIIAVMLAVVAIFLMLKRQSDLPDGLEKEILAHYGIGDTFSYAGDIWASTELPVGSCLLYTRFVPVKVISARSVSGKESGIYEEYLRPDGRTGLELPLRAYQIEIRYNRKCLYSRIIWRVNKEKCVLPVNHLIW